MMENPQTPKYSKITFKASHNTYTHGESIEQQLNFDKDNPYQGGCMCLEFDILRNTKRYTGADIPSDFFVVAHLPGDRGLPNTKDLSVWLGYVRAWHLTHADHLPILIYLDPKSGGGFDNFETDLDNYIRKYFLDGLTDDIIFKPGDFNVPQGKTLCEHVIEQDWKTLEELKNKFIFCITGKNGWNKTYSEKDLLTQRLCFSDKEYDKMDALPPDSGNIIFFNFHVYSSSTDKWTKSIPAFTSRNLITRAFEVNGEDLWAYCIKATFSAVATNKIKNHKWAYVSNDKTIYKLKESSKTSFYGSLKNKANNKYRNDHATEMVSSYEEKSCKFLFTQEDQGEIYSIKNLKNNKYFTDHITSMGSKVVNNDQKWKLIPNGTENQYYIQNLTNQEYMTKKASKLSKNNGSDEIYIIEKRD